MTKLLHFFLLFMNISNLRSLHVGFEFQGVEKNAFSDIERVSISLSQLQQAVGTGQLALSLYKFGSKKLLAHLLTQGFFLCLTSIAARRQQQGNEDNHYAQLLHFACKGKKKREKCQIYENYLLPLHP